MQWASSLLVSHVSHSLCLLLVVEQPRAKCLHWPLKQKLLINSSAAVRCNDGDYESIKGLHAENT